MTHNTCLLSSSPQLAGHIHVVLLGEGQHLLRVVTGDQLTYSIATSTLQCTVYCSTQQCLASTVEQHLIQYMNTEHCDVPIIRYKYEICLVVYCFRQQPKSVWFCVKKIYNIKRLFQGFAHPVLLERTVTNK